MKIVSENRFSGKTYFIQLVPEVDVAVDAVEVLLEEGPDAGRTLIGNVRAGTLAGYLQGPDSI